jgi:hypothetical protein
MKGERHRLSPLKMSNLYRGHSIDASYMFRLIWPHGFRGGDLKKIGQSETRIACGGPCLVMDHNKMFAKGNVGFGITWRPFVVCHLSSVNFSHFNLLL